MLRFPLLLAAVFLILSCPVKGQSSRVVSGTLLNSAHKPAEGAVVSLFIAGNGKLVKAALADSSGHYVITFPAVDSFLLKISYTEHLPFTGPAMGFPAGQTALHLPAITLQSSASGSLLSGVTVQSRIPFAERKIDRTVINPDALIANAGTNALEVLEKAPGVQVDVNGNISLQGKQGVLIYVDDKPTYLSASDLANYLRSIPSGSLGLIEIMTNPPAKYDAAGNAGVINIKLKRSRTTGISGGVNLAYGQGIYPRTNNSANFSYRFNKVNLFSNVSYVRNNNFQDLRINRAYFTPSGTLSSLFNQQTYIRMENASVNAKAGIDFYASDRSTFGLVLTGFNNQYDNFTSNFSEVSDGNEVLQSKVTALSPMQRKFTNGSVNINYTLKTKRKGEELSINGDHIRYKSRQDQELASKTEFILSGQPDTSTRLISILPASILISTAKADYTRPLKNNGKLEAGIKTSFIRTTNVADFMDAFSSFQVPNYDFSNQFNYKENIHAGYINFSQSFSRLSLQAGLRLENTHVKGQQFGNPTRTDSSFTRTYTSLFPTFYAQYNLDSVAKNVLSFSYGRRIDRPNYQSMNPFTYPLDRFTLYAGNPFLQPTFSNNFELSHTYRNMITTSLHFSYVKDVISETIEQRSNIFYSRPGNIGKQFASGISVNAGIPLKKWWTLQVYTEVMHNVFRGNLYTQQLNNRGTYWYIGPNNQFVFGKNWAAELSGTYQTSVASGQFVTVPVWSVRSGISKKILKNQGSIKLAVTDIFYSNQPGGEIKAIANSTASWRSNLDTRVATLSFSYRFSKGKGLAARNTGGSDTEKSRVK